MLAKEILNLVKSVNSVAVILVAAVAVLLVTSSASGVVGEGGLITQEAYVLGIDPGARTLEVQLFETDVSSDIRSRGEIALSFSDVTNVMLCDETLSFDDIKVGDMVTVTYYETSIGFYAETIDLAAPHALMC